MLGAKRSCSFPFCALGNRFWVNKVTPSAAPAPGAWEPDVPGPCLADAGVRVRGVTGWSLRLQRCVGCSKRGLYP